MPPKCSSSGKIVHNIIQYKAEYNILDCCARRLFSLQPDYMAKNCEIEERIQGRLDNPTGHWVIYYSKFHCELNHIKYLWCDSKSNKRKNCTYTIRD